MSQHQADQWRSSKGFLFAALGSAIGLGNIWRFAYVAGENGGGAFVLAYLLAILGLGLPLLIAELAIGRAGHADAVSAFARIAPRRPWRWAGWPGVAATIVILGYYPVVAGWVGNYLWRAITGGIGSGTASEHAARFAGILADPVQVMGWQAAVIAAGVAIVALGVGRGIERASSILMPLFLVLLVAMALHGLTLPGAGQALVFLFHPDWAALGNARTWLAAVGQAFFSIGLAMGILVTFGGYLADRQRLPRAAAAVVTGDTLVALVAGLMIFPAVFTHGFDPAQGTTLVFSVLPEVFATMPAGRWMAVAFFLLLLIAGLTSVVALLEVPVSLLVARRNWRRGSAALAVGAGGCVLGLPAALGFSVLAPWLPGDTSFLDLMDRLASDILLPVSGMAIALFAGWCWRRPEALRAAGFEAGLAAWLWLWSLRLLLPVAILLIILQRLPWAWS